MYTSSIYNLFVWITAVCLIVDRDTTYACIRRMYTFVSIQIPTVEYKDDNY